MRTKKKRDDFVKVTSGSLRMSLLLMLLLMLFVLLLMSLLLLMLFVLLLMPLMLVLLLISARIVVNAFTAYVDNAVRIAVNALAVVVEFCYPAIKANFESKQYLFTSQLQCL